MLLERRALLPSLESGLMFAESMWVAWPVPTLSPEPYDLSLTIIFTELLRMLARICNLAQNPT